MPTSLGPAEILVILVVALIVLGPKRLPEAGRQVGKAMAEVRRWANDMKSEVQGVLDVDTPTASTVVAPVVVSGTTTSVASHDEPSGTEVVQPVTVAVDRPSVAVDYEPVDRSPSDADPEPEPTVAAASEPGVEPGQSTDDLPDPPPGDPARL